MASTLHHGQPRKRDLWTPLLKRSSLAASLESADTSFFMATLGAIAFLPLLDMAVFNSLLPWGSALGSAPTLMLLLFTCLSTGLLLAAREECRTERARLHAGLSLLRVLVLGLPAIGLASLPLWRADSQKQATPAGPPAVLWRKLASLGPTYPGLLWILFSGPASAGLLLSEAGSWPVACRPLLIGASLVFHVGMAVAAFHSLRGWARGEDSLWRRLQPALALLWLLPIPYLVFGGFIAAGLCYRQRPQPLHTALTGLPTYVDLLREQVRRWHATAISRRPGQSAGGFRKARRQPASTRLVLLHHRVRCYLLVLEAAALMLVLGELAGKLPGVLEASVAGLLMGLLGAGLLAAIVAVVLVVTRAWQRLVGIDGRLALLDRHPYHRFVAVGWLALVAGLGLGSGLSEGSIDTVGSCLALFGLGAAIADVVPLFWQMLPSAQDDPESGKLAPTLWVLVNVCLAMTGVALVRRDLTSISLTYLQLEQLVAFSPILGPLVGAAAMRRLLRPYTMQSLSRGAEERPQALAMATTLLLPFGGLLVPWWIYLHHRHWPQQQLPGQETEPGPV